MDLDAAADQLYAALPDRFVAERTALVRQARSDGDKQLATAVQALRKPSAAAWAVNHLVRAEPELVDQLLALGEQLRTAQASLAGDELRQLTRQRGQLVQAVARRARALASDAGHPVSDATTEEVEETLRAALADPAAGAAVRSGRLTSALSYAGLGEVDLSGAVAPGRRSPAPAPPPPPSGPSELELKRARKAVEDADSAAAEALEALEGAEVARREAEERREALAAEIAELEEQLEHAQAEAHDAAGALRTARRQHDTAARAAERARKALERLESQQPG